MKRWYVGLVVVSIALTIFGMSAHGGLLDKVGGAANEALQKATGGAVPDTGGTLPPQVQGTGGGSSQQTCDQMAGNVDKKLEAISYQPDKMMTSRFVDKAPAKQIFESEGFTCEKVNTRQDYTSSEFCQKPYSNPRVNYNCLYSRLDCKGDKCDLPDTRCANDCNSMIR